ncbi:MAG: hypothetical protein ACW99U_08895 [Candidatus Thorarchaeota archaeon]|jgi:hypothetical protein
MNTTNTSVAKPGTKDRSSEESTAVVIIMMIVALNAIGDLIPGEELGPARLAVSVILAAIALSIIWYLGRQLRNAVVTT